MGTTTRKDPRHEARPTPNRAPLTTTTGRKQNRCPSHDGSARSSHEAHFLPTNFSLTGHYTKRQTDHTKAYLLLVHAELESYFEDRAEHLVSRAQEQWQRHARCTPLLSRVILYHHATEKKELEAISTDTVSKAVNAFLYRLKQNHGIKEQHLRNILLPLGINHQTLDTQLIAACNQLARKRGQFAHASFKAHQPIDPKTERDNIHKNILPELKKLDRRLTALS